MSEEQVCVESVEVYFSTKQSELMMSQSACEDVCRKSSHLRIGAAVQDVEALGETLRRDRLDSNQLHWKIRFSLLQFPLTLSLLKP
jgi:hypothetical protein